jgi:hypothetical protein
MGSVSETLPVPAKYIWGALILYVLGAAVVGVMHPSSNEVEIVTDGLLWPLSIFGFVWKYLVSFFGPLFS